MQLLKPIEVFSLLLILLIHVNVALSLNDTAFAQHNSRDVASANAISNDFNSCSGVEESVIWDGFWIAISALRRADFRLDNIIRNIFDRQPGPTDRIKGEDRTATRTFEAIFGHVYFGSGDTRNHAGRFAVLKMQRRVRKIIDAFENSYQDRIEIWCDDSWLASQDPDTGTPYPPDRQWDTRPLDRGGQHFTLRVGTCLDRPPLVEKIASSTTVWGTTGYGDFGLITFCPIPLRKFHDNGLWRGGSLFLNPGERDGVMTLETIQEFHIAPVLIHELSHIRLFTGDDLFTKDLPVDGDAYSWYAITYHAQHDQRAAMSNANNFAMFVTAMYMDNYDWAQGFNRGLPSDMNGFGPLPGLYRVRNPWED